MFERHRWKVVMCTNIALHHAELWYTESFGFNHLSKQPVACSSMKRTAQTSIGLGVEHVEYLSLPITSSLLQLQASFAPCFQFFTSNWTILTEKWHWKPLLSAKTPQFVYELPNSLIRQKLRRKRKGLFTWSSHCRSGDQVQDYMCFGSIQIRLVKPSSLWSSWTTLFNLSSWLMKSFLWVIQLSCSHLHCCASCKQFCELACPRNLGSMSTTPYL